MPTKRFCTAFLATVIVFYVPSVFAEIFQWVDAKGETHFSDKAPKSAPSKVIRKPQAVKKAVTRKKVAKKPVVKKRLATKTKPAVVKKRPVSRPAPKKIVQTRRVPPVKQPKPRKVRKSVVTHKPVKRAKSIARKTAVPRPSARINQRKLAVPRPLVASQALALTASLDATFYDIERIAVPEPETETEVEPEFVDEEEQPPVKVIKNVKESLCRDNRRLLAVLQEIGFESYYDEAGDHRVAWGVEGFYREKRRYLSKSDVAKKTKEVLIGVRQYCDKPDDLAQQSKARTEWIRSEYCAVSKVILADLKHPFMRTSERDIKAQALEVDRFCDNYHDPKYRNDERYYPQSLQVKRLQQKHFLYR